jgi:ribonuclease HI
MVWTVNTDGGCRDNPGPGAWAFVIRKENDTENCSGFLPHCTNNQAEYRSLEAALITILNKSQEEFPTEVNIFSDSQLIVNQINGVYRVNDQIRPYYETTKVAFLKLQEVCPVTLTWIRREFNTEADALCNAQMDRHGIVCSKKGKRRED